MNSESITQELH